MNIMKKALSIVLCTAAAGTLACSFHARSPEQYRDDTRALLETRNADVKRCYDEALVRDATAAGVVALRFTVSKETGAVVKAEIDPAGTTAPEQLGQCVVGAVQGLTLQPPDERDGLASFVFEFRINPPPAPAS
jgi:hypothetical protein